MTASRRRVVITGIGIVSAIGTDTDTFWNNALAGETRVEPVPDHWHHHARLRSTIWSPLPEMDYAGRGLSRSELLQRDRVCLNALCAAGESLQRAGLATTLNDRRANTFTIDGIDATRGGVYVGSAVGGSTTLLDNYSYQVLARPKRDLKALCGDTEIALGEDYRELLQRMVHPRRVNPFVIPMIMPNCVSASIGIKYGLQGPNHTPTVACASGTAGVGLAFRAIRDDQLDMAIAGGSEYIADPYGGMFYGFDLAGTLVTDCDDPETANRPFDAARSGFLYSEGGTAIMVLEERAHALARGAPVIAEVTGYAESFDAFSIMSNATDGRQIERMIRAATLQAGIMPGDIDYLNTHGTGTATNDSVEAEIIGRVFPKTTLVNSTKSLLGHTIGASGALEVAVTALSLDNQTTHACRNLDDPIADLNFVTEVRPREMEHAFSHSFAFGGHNAGVVLRHTT